MAESKCQNCNSTQFEIQTKEIKKGQDNLNLHLYNVLSAVLL